MIHEFPKEYREIITYQQAEETMLRFGRMYDGGLDYQGLINCMMLFKKHYEEELKVYEQNDSVDEMMHDWRYEINAYNFVYLYFQPLFAPQTN
tara:strand:+ start:63 stop:341 length:279 start_codon:yes stop_codon:yes gene_type:complete